MPRQDTKAKILSIATDLIGSGGLDALSFDAIAARLGKSKQAVLYWFPTKNDLLLSLFLPWLRAEADAVTKAIAGATDRATAIRLFAEAVAAFHADDLDRYRLMYLVPQTIRQGSQSLADPLALKEINQVTDRIYEALAARLGGSAQEARQEAMSLHASLLGILLMVALANRMQDPLKHSLSDLVDALVKGLTAR
ncbi:MAG: TetR/AcrR family transcriptional regulator [Sulfitobacter sp.]|nr:TetR/AcrR family transcriptional regulator [Sulfitobacter sp.]